MRKFWMLFLAMSCLGISGCAATAPAGIPDVVLDEPSPPIPITTLKTGQRLLIRMKENPTTGYIWEIKAVDVKILQPELPAYKPSVPEQADSGIPTRVGAGGVKTFVFNALAPGKTRICLVNHRTWEKKDEKTIDLEIVVVD